MQFTGVPYNGSGTSNAASNYADVTSCTWPTVSLWNLWTKDNTHGENDPVINNSPLHDGASIMGLAGATLEKGVITSHAAYDDIKLSYANDGPNDSHDIEYYTYGFATGTSDST